MGVWKRALRCLGRAPEGNGLKSPAQGQPVSICIHCAQEHDASLRACPKTGKAIASALPAMQKTLFGVPAALAPPPRSPALPPPSTNQSSALALGKTMFGVMPASPKAQSAASPKAPAPASSQARLPTEMEARENPDLVISLDFTPTPGPAAVVPKADTRSVPAVGDGTPVDLPFASYSGPVGIGKVPTPAPPTDLPPPGMGKPFALPRPPESAGTGTAQSGGNGGFADRLAEDTRTTLDYFHWALDLYLRRPGPMFLLAAMLILPASILQSCLLAGVSPGTAPSVLASTAATVDFSARKATLAARIQASQALGEFDKQAAAELAALTTVETTQVPVAATRASEGSGWIREKLALLIQGLLIFGLAFPMASGALAIAAADRQSGAALPGWGDIGPILMGRSEYFLVSLVPAGLLVALGQAFFVLPGLVLSVVFVFVPHAVLFEKRSGRPALMRSFELVRADAIRVSLAFLSFALLGFAAATLTELLLPTSGSRAVVFLHFIISDLLSVAVFPLPALILARIYFDLRSRTGATPERLSRAARA